MNDLKDFFNQLSVESGIIDISSVKQIYYGLSRLFNKKLHQESIINLPEIGEFELRNVGKSGQKIFKGKPVKPYKMIRYVPDRNLKKQIKFWE